MTKKLPKRGLPPMHPGELLREEILPALDRSRTENARLLGVSRQTLYDVLKAKQPVTPGMALRLGKLCGNGQSAKALRSASGLAGTRRKDQENSDVGSCIANDENGAPRTINHVCG
jgi:addiction module HigA family antidote